MALTKYTKEGFKKLDLHAYGTDEEIVRYKEAIEAARYQIGGGKIRHGDVVAKILKFWIENKKK
jgi:hypothetical protein